MAIKATGQITIVDLSDSRQLSVYLTANLPKTQILNLSTGTTSPDWTQENLEITPNILLNQVNIPLTDTNLTVTYKRKDGSGAESSLVDGETVTNKVLKVNKNILESSDAKSITYICYVSYLDTKLNLTVSAQADINFSLVTSGTEGVGVNEIKEYYYSSTSATELAGGEWSETYPGWESGKYIWTKSIIIYTDNTTKETTPICVSGADGKDGENGKDGTNGNDGRGIISTVIEYQSSTSGVETPTGTWQTSIPNVTEGNYLWTRTTINYTDNTNSISYSVSYVAKDGKDGEDGASGSDGIGISTTNITYQKSTNGQTIPTGTWATSIPTVGEGEYLWTRTEFVYTDNSKKYAYSVGQMGKSGQDGTDGTDGIGIESVDVYYYLSTSSTTQTDGSWNTTAPTWVDGKYMWSKTIVTYTDNTTKESDPVCITGAKGATGETTYFHIKYSAVANPTDAQITDTPSEYIGTYVDFNATASTSASKYTWVKFQGTDGKDGEDGTPGTNGINGETSYLHIAYADSADGTTNFSTTDSTNKKYMGQYVDFATADSTNPDDYKWSLIKGADGTNGEDGSDGRGISATTVTYQVSSSGTTAPTGTWTSSIPTVAQGKYLWTKTTITYTDNTTSDSYSVSRAATDGSKGVGIQSVANKYAVSTSNTTEPTTWYDTPQIMTSTKKYLWNYEIITYTDSTTTETDARVIGVYGDTGQSGSNGTNGEDGKGISSIKEYYQVSTSNTTAPTTWSESVVAMSATNKYLWNYEVITYTDNTTTETSKRVIGVYGDKGATGNDGKGIESTTITYQASTSGTTTPSGTWLTSIPTVSAGSYLWTRTVVTYTDDTTSTSYSVGKMGDTGSAGKNGTSITIASTSVTYQAGTSGTTAPTGTWSSSVPSVSNGQYLWTKTVVTYSDSTSTTAYSVSYKGTNGTNGADGADGKDGTSVTISSKSVTYQASTSGTTTPTGTWSTTVPSVTKGQYLWTKTVVTYSTGDSTTSYSVAYQGTNGTNGTNGTDGVGISATSITYQASSSGTTVPTGSWLTTIPSVSAGQYLWTKTEITYTDDNTSVSYSVGRNGTNGTTARTYWISSSTNTVTRSMTGTLTPATITFGAYYRDGTSATSTAYSGRFIIQESADGATWTTKYTSSANESSKVYTPTATTNLVKCTMYAAGGTTNKLDELTIGIIDSIDDLQIGGKNFLLKSKWIKGNWDLETGELNTNYSGRIAYSDYVPVEAGVTYCTQLFTDGTKSANILCRGYDSDKTKVTSIAPMSTIYTVPDNVSYLTFTIYDSVTVDDIINGVLKPKFEKGNVPTDWSPAPEDMEERIEEVNKSVSEVIVGTQTAATNAWTGVASFSTLVDGQQISYWLPYTGNSSSATLNLTLADGTTTGAKNLYYQGTTRITTHYPAGSVVHLTYRENVSIAGSSTTYTGWWGDANYAGSDTYDRIRYNSAITAVTAISAGRVIAGTASGFQHIAASTAFDINKPILYAGSAISASATGSNNYIAYSNLNLSSTKSGFTGTKGKTVYIVGTLNGTTFTPNSTVFTTTEPTSADGLVYIALGVMSSTTNSTLFPEHPLYKYVNGKFQSLSQVAYEAQENLDNLKIGGRNLALQSNIETTNNNYNIATYVPSEILIAGETYTCTICVTPAEGVSVFGLYLSSGYTSQCNFSISGTEKQIISQTFTAKYNADRIPTDTTNLWSHLQFYRFPNDDTVTESSTFHWVKIEKGDKATDWTPAPEDMATEYQLQAEAKTLQESINTVNESIRADVETDMQNLKSVIEDDYAAAIDAKATATKKEIDETTGQKVRDLEKYTSELKVNGSSFNYSIEKTKGTNLIKNSVMLQNKQNTSSQTKANFWLNKNLEEDFFTNVTCSDVDSIRAKTDSGSAIIFDYSTDATGLTYDYILSTPIDFKINTDNVMLSYKIKSTISAGTFFAGLVFYKKDTTATGLGATTAFAQTTGIPTAHYLALNEYDTSSEYADFTQDYVLRTTPFVKNDKKRVTWTCEVSEDNTITLPYEPYLVNGSCEVTLYNLDNTTSTVATTSTTVTLDEEQEWPSAIAVSYDRAISNFAGTTATSITASNFSTVLVNEVLMYYDTSDNKIWVYNPFTGAYVKSTNLYNDTDYSEVDSVRVILGVRGASTSTKFKGHVEISDLKVEFDSLSTIWTQHPGETYSKQYTMDEKGFSISSDTNMMFIDEDEIAAYTLDDKGKPNTDDPVFQISGEKTILKKTIVKEDLLIENTTENEDDAFTMKQYYVNGQWFFLFY